MNRDQKSKWVTLVAKLNDLTQSGGIIWDIHIPYDKLKYQGDDVGLVYTMSYRDRFFRIYNANVKIWEDFDDRYEWGSKIYFEMIDENENSLFIFLKVAGVDNLLQSVKVQTSGIDELLDDI